MKEPSAILKDITQTFEDLRKQQSNLHALLLQTIWEIQKSEHLKEIDMTDCELEYYSHYSQDTSPVTAIKVEKDGDNYALLVKVDDGNGDDFFDPFADGSLDMEDLAQALAELC